LSCKRKNLIPSHIGGEILDLRSSIFEMKYVGAYLLCCGLAAMPGFIEYSISVGDQHDVQSCGVHICNTISCVSGEELWYGYVFMCCTITTICVVAVYDLENLHLRDKKEWSDLGVGKGGAVIERILYVLVFCGFQLVGWFPENCRFPVSTGYHRFGLALSCGSGVILTIYFLNLYGRVCHRSSIHKFFWAYGAALIFGGVMFGVANSLSQPDHDKWAAASITLELIVLTGHLFNTTYVLRSCLIPKSSWYLIDIGDGEEENLPILPVNESTPL
jgi:hypothetical protein